MRVAFVALLIVASVHASAGPGNEEPGQELEVDEAYKEHVASLMSAIQESEGKSDVKYTELKPQQVDMHTIAPRLPALKVGMNALGHKMLHVHSDEAEGTWSSEIMSSGASAGFTFTDRVKGLQKGNGEEGSQWTIYSNEKSMRIKDEAAGDLLQMQDGLMTLQANQGKHAKKPSFTIIGASDSVPRVTLVSKQGENAKHISLYNQYGKFGVFSGVLDTSIFHIESDGSEMLLTTANVQPHITIQSTAKGSTSQELVLKGHDTGLKMYHKSENLGFCKIAADGKACDSFMQASTDGQKTDFISQTESATLQVSHKIRGGNSEIKLVSQDAIGDLTSTDIFNQAGSFGLRSEVKNVKKDLLTVKPTGETTVHGKLEVENTASFKKGVTFAGNIEVTGVVTMQGRSVTAMMEDMEATKSENMLMRKRMEEMEDDTKELRNTLVEMQQSNMEMRERMERMMSTMSLMQETMTSA